jgi:hypothetical protein
MFLKHLVDHLLLGVKMDMKASISKVFDVKLRLFKT